MFTQPERSVPLADSAVPLAVWGVGSAFAEATPLVDALHEWLPNDFHVTCGASSRLDYVYLTRGLYDRVTEVRVVVDRYTRPIYAGVSDIWRPSDHRPILVDFDF